MRTLSVASLALVACMLAQPSLAAPPLSAPPVSAESGRTTEIEQAIAALESRLEAGLARRDAALLETVVAEPFTWVHASDGRVDGRADWLAAAAKGMALAGQRSVRTEHGLTLAVYGGDAPHTAVRTSRVRLVDAARARETWLRQTRVYVRGGDGGWRMALGQGVMMYAGPPLDDALHARYAGRYQIEPNRSLALRWEDGGLLATFPDGSQTQIFLASPTEEAVRSPGADKLRFALDAQGQPVQVVLTRNNQEIWRATRNVP